MADQHLRRYFFIALFLGAAFFAVRIFWPFAKVIVLSIAISAVLYPLYVRLLAMLKKSWVAALFTVLFFIIVLCLPVFFIGAIVLNQTQNLYAWIIDNGGVSSMIDMLNTTIARIAPTSSINIESSITAIAGRVTSTIGVIFSATLSTILSTLLVALSMFYFLKDGAQWKQSIISLSPLSPQGSSKILEKLNSAVNGIVKGYLLIALVQGLLMGVGLFLFGVPHPALWGVLAGIASLIPTIGTALISIPTILFLLATGHTNAAIGMAVWAGVLVGSVDNVLNPILVGRKIAIHPLLVLFSVLGGIALMGPVGILIGPLVISFIYALMSVYKSEMVS